NFALVLQLFNRTDQRNHYLGQNTNALFGQVGSSFENRTRLHLGDLGEHDSETAATVTQHRVQLMKLLDLAMENFRVNAQVLGQVVDFLFAVRQALLQRRIQQADRYRQTIHLLEQTGEVITLVLDQLGERLAALRFVLSHDHLANKQDTLRIE